MSLRVAGPEEDWTDIRDRKARRKLQNRLNVRAHRERKAQKNEAKGVVDGPFGVLVPTVYRGPGPVTQHLTPAAVAPGESAREGRKDMRLATTSASSSHGTASISSQLDAFHRPISPALSPDNLVPLVQYNLVRASVTNAAILSLLHLLPRDDCVPLQSEMPLFPLPTGSGPGSGSKQPNQRHAGVASPSPSPIPASLLPTRLQLSTPHDYWVDLIPDPTLRDNLLLALVGGLVDVVGFQADLFGQICPDNYATVKADPERCCRHRGGSSSSSSSSRVDDAARHDGVGDGRGEEGGQVGIVVWNTPWSVDGYEVTEAFFKRWPLLFKGCRDLLDATNRWRQRRGEEPLVLELG